MIDLERLARMAPPDGKGSVTLRTSVFMQLLSELHATREGLARASLAPSTTAAPDLTAEDRVDLEAISEAIETGTRAVSARLLLAYYGNSARADRIPRHILYMHMGFLIGQVLLADADERPH